MNVKVDIDRVEWWPVYTINTESSFHKDYEVDEELIKKYKKIMKEFHKMQDQLESIIKEFLNESHDD